MRDISRRPVEVIPNLDDPPRILWGLTVSVLSDFLAKQFASFLHKLISDALRN